MSTSHISPRAPSQLTPLSVHPYTRPACARRARGGGALSPHAPRFARRHSQCMQMTTNAAPALRRRRCSHRRVAAPQLDARHSTNPVAVRYCGYCSARQVDRKGSAQPQFRSLPQMALQRDAYGVGEEAYCQPQGAASAGACCRRRSVAHTRAELRQQATLDVDVYRPRPLRSSTSNGASDPAHENASQMQARIVHTGKHHEQCAKIKLPSANSQRAAAALNTHRFDHFVSSSSTMYGQQAETETSVKVQNLDAKTDREDSANGEISGMVATRETLE